MGSRLDELTRLFGIPREDAERLEVIVAVLSGSMTLDAASMKLRMPPAEVQKLAEAANNAVLRAVGDELEQGDE